MAVTMGMSILELLTEITKPGPAEISWTEGRRSRRVGRDGCRGRTMRENSSAGRRFALYRQSSDRERRKCGAGRRASGDARGGRTQIQARQCEVRHLARQTID